MSPRKLQKSLQERLVDNPFFLFDPFQRSNLQSLSTGWEKMHKTFEN